MSKELLDQIEIYARERAIASGSSHEWDHVQRVVANARKINSVENGNYFIVEAAALLHDIARGAEKKSEGKIDHAITGAVEAAEYLTSLGLDRTIVTAITDCIKTHRYRNNLRPEFLEAKILYDADKLDSIGAIGIGRAFLFSGEVGARLHNGDIEIKNTTAYSNEDTAYREYCVKLKHIKDGLLTDTGKKLAMQRDEFMHNFFRQFQSEIAGER